jgi:hypothetical protein
MTAIIIISLIKVLLIALTIVWLVRYLKAKKSGESKSFLPLFAYVAAIIALLILNIVLIIGYLYENRNEIADIGKEAISTTIEYTSTAILEGFGKTADHFEEKWDEEDLKNLDEIDVKVIDYYFENSDSLRQEITIDIEFNNNGEKDVSFYNIESNNYILISKNGDSFYPISFVNRQNTHVINKETTNLLVMAKVPLDFELKTIKVGNRIIKILK